MNRIAQKIQMLKQQGRKALATVHAQQGLHHGRQRLTPDHTGVVQRT